MKPDYRGITEAVAIRNSPPKALSRYSRLFLSELCVAYNYIHHIIHLMP